MNLVKDLDIHLYMIDSCRRIVLLVCSVALLMPFQVLLANAEVGPPFKFTFSPTFIPEGQVGCIDVIVEGIEDVNSFELAMTFDETLFSFATINSTFIDPDQIAASVSMSNPNTVTIIAFSLFNTIDIPDGSIGFSICFEALGNDGDTSTLVFEETLPNGNPSQIFANNMSFQTPDLCVIGSIITIGDMPIPLDVMTMTQGATCQNSGDGILEIDILGGIQPFSLLVTDCLTGDIIRGPEDVGPTVVINNLDPADYCIEITDSNIPSEVINTTAEIINSGPSLGADFLAIEPNCNGETNGSLEATAILNAVLQPNPSSDFNFVWTQTGGQGTVVGPILDNIGSGTYEVQITEIASGCSVTLSTFLTEPAPIVVDLAVTDETCMTTMGMDGSLAAVTTGGVGGYTFLYDDNNSTTDSIATGLGVGTYTVVVRDANGCPGTDTDDVGAPQPPQILGVDSISVSCPGVMDGELEVLFVDGSAMVDRVEWTIPGGGMQQGARITNLGPGDYLVTVTGLDNCASSVTISLGAPDAVMIDVANSSSTLADCPLFNNGSISVAVFGGMPPYTVFVDNVAQATGATNIPALSPGDYDIFVQDANGCITAVDVFTVGRIPDVTVDFTDIQGVQCFEGPGGAATAVPMGGVGTYNFIWDNSETTAAATSLFGDTNFVNIISGSCNLDTFVIIPQPSELMVNPDIMNVSCFGDSDGQIDLNPSGGTGMIIASSTVPVTGTTLENLSADLYNVIISDANNCEIAVSLEISEPDSLDAFISAVQNITCNGEADGFLEAGFNGGTGNVTYAWSRSSQDMFSTITGLFSGDYLVTVTDENGCIDTAMATIIEPEAISAVIPPIPEALCFNDQTIINVAQATGGNGAPFTYTVNAGPAIPINSPIPVFAGEYTITIFDNLGCRLPIEVTATEPPPVQVSAGIDQEINLGGSALIFGSANSSVGIDSIFWLESPGDSTLSCYDCLTPTANPLDDSVYELFAVDANGCSASDEVFINVDSDRNVFIPNVFSPYQVDGFNDFFSPFTGIGVESVLSFEVYDRWGEQVYSREPFLPGGSEAQGWDGTYRGKIASKGVYLYIIRVQFIDGVILTYRGDVTIL